MYRVIQSALIMVEDERYFLTEGDLVDLPGAAAEVLLALGYVEKARGAKAKAETPESKRKPPESR